MIKRRIESLSLAEFERRTFPLFVELEVVNRDPPVSDEADVRCIRHKVVGIFEECASHAAAVEFRFRVDKWFEDVPIELVGLWGGLELRAVLLLVHPILS